MRCVQDIELERGRYNVEIHSKVSSFSSLSIVLAAFSQTCWLLQ
jgi:hypothetical protein